VSWVSEIVHATLVHQEPMSLKFHGVITQKMIEIMDNRLAKIVLTYLEGKQRNALAQATYGQEQSKASCTYADTFSSMAIKI
jgi:uncharacterized membrane protein